MRVVAVLVEAETARACLEAASRAAAAVAAGAIEAFHPRLRPESMIIPSDEVMTAKRHAELDAVLTARSRALREVVERFAAEPGAVPPPLWNEVEADAVAAAVAARARDADLLVLARPQGPDAEAALQAAIFESARPLLIVPPVPGAAPGFGRHIAIAWKPSDQARRAVTAALPWLRRAERISVLAVGKSDAAAPPDDALALLAASAIEAEPVVMEREGDSVGAQLLRAVHAIGADCLVLGAYRHNRLLEIVLGGVTRHMLREADLPLFLMH